MHIDKEIAKKLVDDLLESNVDDEPVVRPDDQIQNIILLCMRPYILEHREDIENSINDFGDLKPLLDYFNSKKQIQVCINIKDRWIKAKS